MMEQAELLKQLAFGMLLRPPRTAAVEQVNADSLEHSG